MKIGVGGSVRRWLAKTTMVAVGAALLLGGVVDVQHYGTDTLVPADATAISLADAVI